MKYAKLLEKIRGYETSSELCSFCLQYTGEKLGGAEKTELDAHFENLLQRADSTRQWTERILAQTETLLQPNPSKYLHYFDTLPVSQVKGKLVHQLMVLSSTATKIIRASSMVSWNLIQTAGLGLRRLKPISGRTVPET